MAIEENKRLIRQFVEEVLNRKRLDALDTIVAEDFVEHLPLPGQGPGRAGLRDAVIMLHTAFPDMHWTLEEQVAEGQTVVSRFTWTGTHRGDFMGIPPTQRSVKVWGVVIDGVRDGWFAESRIIMDTMALLQQLGVMPGDGK